LRRAATVPGRGRGPEGRERRGRRAAALLAIVAVFAGAALESAVGAGAARAGAPTRDGLDLLRRKVALLESELALSRSRKPYLVVDASAKRLRYSLLGMTMREITAPSIRIDGLRLAGEGGTRGPLTMAGIVTLKDKEKDPRLEPLTPEQIEAGAADENVADALPPEAPADFDLRFKQAIVLRVEGVPEKKSAWSRASGWWGRLWPGGGGGQDRISLRLDVRLDETAAREVYRSLIPGLRLVIVPPAGLLLPDAGQEAPRSVRPGRPARSLVPLPGPPSEGVPFRIPPPVAEAPADGATPANDGTSPGGAGGPAVEGAPAPPPAANPGPAPPKGNPPAPAPPAQDPPAGGAPSPAPGGNA